MYVLFRGKRKRPPDSGETLDLGAPGDHSKGYFPLRSFHEHAIFSLSDEMKGAMSTLLNAVIFEQWLRFSWIEEDEEGDFCIQIPAETVSELVEDYPNTRG